MGNGPPSLKLVNTISVLEGIYDRYKELDQRLQAGNPRIRLAELKGTDQVTQDEYELILSLMENGTYKKR